MPYNKRYIIFVFSSVLIILIILATSGSSGHNSFSASPPFVRQEISDAPLDFRDFASDPFVNCSERWLNRPSIDIGAVSYVSDGRTVNSTIWLEAPIREPIERGSDKYLERVSLAVQNLSSPWNKTLEEYFNETIMSDMNKEPFKSQNYSSINVTYTAIDDIPSLQMNYNYNLSGLALERITLVTIKDDKAYVIRYDGEQGKSQDFLKEFIDSIIIKKDSPIKPTNATAKHSIYENYGIRFEYPTEWKVRSSEPDYIDLRSIPSGENDEHSDKFSIEVEELYHAPVSLGVFSNVSINNMLKGQNFTIVNSTNVTSSDGDQIDYYIIGIGNFTRNDSREPMDNKFITAGRFTIRDGKGYSIVYSAEPTQFYKTNVSGIFDSMTFGSDKPGWFAYQDPEHRIKMFYPPDWRLEDVTDKLPPGVIMITSPPEISPWKSISYSMYIDIISVFDKGIDYVYSAHWDKNTNEWEKSITEFSSTGDGIQRVNTTNYTEFFDKDRGFVKLSADLKNANFPNQYNLVFATRGIFDVYGRECDLTDISQFVPVPPPTYVVKSSSDPLILRPGENRSLELHIQSSANLKSLVSLSTGKVKNIESSFTPNSISLRPSGEATSILQIKALDASPHQYTIPISANISFPPTAEGTFHGKDINFSNPVGANILKESNVTLTVLPAYGVMEKISNFTSTVLTPIQGIWTFLAGVGAVIAPLIIRMYSKKTKQK